MFALGREIAGWERWLSEPCSASHACATWPVCSGTKPEIIKEY